jgi:hypothetical protein
MDRRGVKPGPLRSLRQILEEWLEQFVKPLWPVRGYRSASE